MCTVKVRVEWKTVKTPGTANHTQTGFLIQGVLVALISSSGNWGWYVQYLDGLKPMRISKYVAKKETAMKHCERRFGIHSTQLRNLYYKDNSTKWDTSKKSLICA